MGMAEEAAKSGVAGNKLELDRSGMKRVSQEAAMGNWERPKSTKH